jgi:hypothetical protein
MCNRVNGTAVRGVGQFELSLSLDQPHEEAFAILSAVQCGLYAAGHSLLKRHVIEDHL